VPPVDVDTLEPGRPQVFQLRAERADVPDVVVPARLLQRRPVVTAGGEETRGELAGLPVDVIDDDSVAGAIKVALTSTPHLDAALVLRASQGSATAADFSRLFARFRASHAAIVAACDGRTVGLPAVFGRSVFGDLLALAPESDVKSLIAAHSREVLTVPMPQAGSQIESAEEYETLRER